MELRELTVTDTEAYYALVARNREHLNQRGNYPFEAAATFDDIAGYFREPWDHNVRLGVWVDGGLVGRVDLNPIDPPRWVIGYWIDVDHTGRGIATQACRMAIDHARTLGASEIYAGITHGNHASVGMVQRLGFQHIEDLPDRSRWRLDLAP